MFRHQLAEPAPRRRVVTVDQRGHVRSAKPHHGYRIARLARDAQELLDHLAIERADVLGWSMGVSVWWSFIDQFGTGRIRRFVAVDQPAAVAAVPWMSVQEQADSGAIFDVSVLLGLCAALAGPESDKATADFVHSMFSGDTDPDLLPSSIPSWGRSRRTRACRCCGTTARRTGGTCCRASTCPPS
jgi:pimeloyl-ACP methyl ester carboxylesterase